MDISNYIFINKFRIDILDFNLYTNEKGQFVTTCKFNDNDSGNEIGEPEKYKDFEQLYEIFSDDFTVKQLKEIVSGVSGYS